MTKAPFTERLYTDFRNAHMNERWLKVAKTFSRKYNIPFEKVLEIEKRLRFGEVKR